jgi:DNA-directed RNA polymerase II subunit RPB2
MGKFAGVYGCRVDGTPFNDEFNLDYYRQQLVAAGYNPHGNEILICGKTGKRMPVEIFIGPTFYQRLKHMVDDKMHCRGKGPINYLIGQPTGGKRKDGGGKIGEMEADCLRAHGCAHFMNERMFVCSDENYCYVCDECNRIATVNETNGIFECRLCSNYSKFSQIPFGKSWKSFHQELSAAGIEMRYITE